MRGWVIAMAFCAAGCGAPHAPPETAPAPLDRDALVGVWSFDRSCASGDGMLLGPDGGASFDEWGDGVWRLDGRDLHIALTYIDPGIGPTGETAEYILSIARLAGDELNGELKKVDSADDVRVIDALRCPETQ